MKNIEKKREISSLLNLSFFISFLVFIFAPLEFYLTNKDYFFFGGNVILPYITLFFVAGFITVTVLLILIYKFLPSCFKIIIGILFGLFLAFYIQGNFVIVDYGAMDGKRIEWDKYFKEGIVSISVFIVCLSIVVFLSYKLNNLIYYRFLQVVSICLVLVQFVTLSTLMITHHGLYKEAEYLSTEDGEFSLSKDENIIVLLLDTFDSKLFDDMLKEDTNKYEKILNNFVYYPDTAASYSSTDLAIPSIITGLNYKNDKLYGEYLRESYSASPFLNKLNKNNWYCGIYSVCMPPQGEVAEKVDNYERIERTVSSHKRLMEYMYKFIGFRYLPQPLKKFCWFYPDEIRSTLECTVDKSKKLFNDNNYIFYDNIQQFVGDNTKKTFHFYHLDGTHAPFTIKSDFTGSDTDVGIEEEARGMMVLIDAFLNKLKEENVYDSSTIIIMADHGYYNSRQNPVFIVKDKESKEAFKVSKVPVSFNNLQEVFVKVMDGELANNIISDSIKEENRIFYYYLWNNDLGENSYSSDIEEYNVLGEAGDINKLKYSGKIYKSGK